MDQAVVANVHDGPVVHPVDLLAHLNTTPGDEPKVQKKLWGWDDHRGAYEVYTPEDFFDYEGAIFIHDCGAWINGTYSHDFDTIYFGAVEIVVERGSVRRFAADNDGVHLRFTGYPADRCDGCMEKAIAEYEARES